MEKEISICIVLTVKKTCQNGNYITAMINNSRLFSIRQQARNHPVNSSGKNTAHLSHTANCPPTSKWEHKHNLKRNPAFILPIFCFVLIFLRARLGDRERDRRSRGFHFSNKKSYIGVYIGNQARHEEHTFQSETEDSDRRFPGN